MSNKEQYLVFGSVPDLVENFMKAHDFKAIEQIGATSFIAEGDADINIERSIGDMQTQGFQLGKTANVYNAAAAKKLMDKDFFFSPEEKSKIKAWALKNV